ncbi:unnamed protein product [Peniophora sp. CBMAI 1063]|nr:unnamed protein product [Peniophora sp. CBMAI 1063]
MPSEAGKTFSVHYATVERHTHEHKLVSVIADGRELTTGGSIDQKSGSLRNCRVSETLRQPFMFAQVTLEPDEDPSTGSQSDDVGVIEVKIWDAIWETSDGRELLLDEPTGLDTSIRLSERSKLIGANHTKLGAVHTSKPIIRRGIVTAVDVDEPVGDFPPPVPERDLRDDPAAVSEDPSAERPVHRRRTRHARELVVVVVHGRSVSL